MESEYQLPIRRVRAPARRHEGLRARTHSPRRRRDRADAAARRPAPIVAATTVARTPWTARGVSCSRRHSTPNAQHRTHHAFAAARALAHPRGPRLAMTRGRDRKISDRDRTRGGRWSPRRLIAIGGRSAKVVLPPLPCRSWKEPGQAGCGAARIHSARGRLQGASSQRPGTSTAASRPPFSGRPEGPMQHCCRSSMEGRPSQAAR